MIDDRDPTTLRPDGKRAPPKPRTLAQAVAYLADLFADESDDLRDALTNGGRALVEKVGAQGAALEAIGETQKYILEGLGRIEASLAARDEQDATYRQATAERFAKIERSGANGHAPAE